MTLDITGGPPFSAVARKTWTRRYTDGAVVFGRSARPPERAPRVWSGRGLGLPESELPEFAAQLKRVMKHEAYWRARGDARQRWSPGRYDDEDGFVYFAGPCTQRDPWPGYRPTSEFTVALPHVRGLRIRVAAHLAAFR
ncbi:hypothetical protein [Amycolatopsis australiensis]|uniref:Uncharacterized protein n=1 Tax=Amycolatopsis australiensis TaxID=546364 RepID=A0A1K1SUI3_9PSEU|nr:hypothetical protein [Amycolatopsis australiensis]SFW87509.1 hypothetical protein SAMN04489730_6701 [Amycolatopsis australiensis]